MKSFEKFLVLNVSVARRCLHELKQIVESKIPTQEAIIKKFKKEYNGSKVSEVTVGSLYGGLRGVVGMICETSLLDPNEGITFRGYTPYECRQFLSCPHKGLEPLPEAMFWLLLSGELPREDQVLMLSEELAERGSLPTYVVDLITGFPKNTDPIIILIAAVSGLSRGSKFAKAYNKGVRKTQHWKYVYEDSLDLIAKLPRIAALIYQHCFRSTLDRNYSHDTAKDWTLNFTDMLGYTDNTFTEFMRLYLTMHCDHEGGNVSTHATRLVGSALSTPHLSYAAGLCGLAGPLHGLANQEVLFWLEEIEQKFGNEVTEKTIRKFVQETLKSGKMIPGYGHAVLRKTDPRYSMLREFALKNLPNYSLFKLASTIYKVAPSIIQATGKIHNPWPNADAHSGLLLKYFGMTETSFYPVLFGVSRSLGTLASLIWDRALNFPVERPKSITTMALRERIEGVFALTTPGMSKLGDINLDTEKTIKK